MRRISVDDAISFGLICLTLLAAGRVIAAESDGVVAVVPEEADEILANPGMGWETFHRTANNDKNLPDWISSTIHYARWGWKTLEPEKGKIDYDFLDGILRETRESGQQLAFRVMCCSPYPRRPYHPEWLRDIGGEIIKTRHGDRSEVEVPVLDDPKILAAHLDFIKRLGARYDGHPDITRLDLGSVGWWGEWHMSRSSNASMPTPETQKKIVDAYLAAFQKTPLVMLIGGGDMLKHAVENGTGWRADSLGDLGTFSPTWNHMFHSYPQRIQAIQDLNAWKNGPIAFEPPAAVAEFVEKDRPLRWIFNYGLAVHGSSFSGKSGRLPDDDRFRQELERFLRRLGYRLVLKELRHPKQAKPGEALKLGTKWQNVGSAPCYKPYRVAYRLSNNDGYDEIFVGQVTVDKCLPGSIELFTDEFFKEPADLPPGDVHDVGDTIVLPKDMPTGEYVLSVGVVGVETTQPVVQLGIKGRGEDGWYPLSEIRVSQEPATRQNGKAAPDFSELKEGITLSQARAILGSSGRVRPNSTPTEAIYHFDFDDTSAVLIVDNQTKSAIVTNVTIWKHGKTVEQVRADRRKKWSEWVEAHSPKGRMKTSMEGWKLYVRQDSGDTYFSLMVGTNRLKTDDEIAQAAVKGLDAIKSKLDELKEGQLVFLRGRHLSERAREDQAKAVAEYCRKIGLKVQ